MNSYWIIIVSEIGAVMTFRKIIGLGTILVIPIVIKRFQPISKEIFKGGVKAGERIKEMAAVVKEDFEDIIAEAQIEIKNRK